MSQPQNPATGSIKSIRREGSDVYVDVGLHNTALGDFDITIKVTGSIPDAPENARQVLCKLALELAKAFEHRGSLQ